ncbi:hypothetical protein EWF20_00570 [Sulfolobus sp. S-194]|uniref:hypothetical protein n=1 Tax=Sulfolobus sp. S-194 TaxID=2512240 RepID=UPI001436DAF0|nr:hypothetical protein [Sulfolobus sp. S-194]QIW22801.1 hypothetical protein EWF20_00570 [Sulfolobus sp. S-194]
MEKFFQMDNVDLNAIHDKLSTEIQNQGMEIHRDEPRDNGFKLFVRRGEDHGVLEVFNDWGGVKVITHGMLEWDLMNIAEQSIQQSAPQPTQQTIMRQPTMPQQPAQPPPYQPALQQPPRPSIPPQQPSQMTFQPMPQTPTQQPPMQMGINPEHQQILNILMQNGYQIMVNTVNQNYFFIRGRKGNFVIDIEGRQQP